MALGVLGNSDHNSTGHKIDKELRNEHSRHRHFRRCNEQISPQKFPPRGPCPILWTTCSHSSPCSLPSTMGHPKLLHRNRAGQPGVDPMSGPGMVPWLGLLCQSVCCQGECCGRSSKGEPVSLCWGQQYPNAWFQCEKNQECTVVRKHSRPVSHLGRSGCLRRSGSALVSLQRTAGGGCLGVQTEWVDRWTGSDPNLKWSPLSLLQGTIVSCAGAHLSLWDVNGQPLASITTAWGPEGAITCCYVVEGPAWDTSHVIITGSQDGMVRVGVPWVEWGHATRNVFISILSTSSKSQIFRPHLNIPDQVPTACEGKGKGFFLY